MEIVSPSAVATSDPTTSMVAQDEVVRRNKAAIELLDKWDRGGDDLEQHETMQVIREALGKNRIGSHRVLFP